jgi:hypothetical protein
MADHASTRRSRQLLLPPAQRSDGAQVEPREQALRAPRQRIELLDRIKRAIDMALADLTAGAAREAPSVACA